MKRVVALVLAAVMVLSSINMLSWNLHVNSALADTIFSDADIQIGGYGGEIWEEPVKPGRPTAPVEDVWDGFFFVEVDEKEDKHEGMNSAQPEVRYAYINRDRYIYSDPERTQRLGIAAKKSAVRVTKVGWYANGDLYEILFDTHKTAGKKKWETGYFYTSHLDMLTEEEAEALDGIRTVNGAKITYVDFYYAEEEDRDVDREIEEPDGPYINDRSVNLRARADRDSVVYARLKKGTQVRVLGSRKGLDGNLWYKVSCKEGTGYVMASLVTNAGSVARLDAPKDEPKEEAQTETPAEIEIAAETETQAEIEVPAETEAPAETETPAATEEMVWTEETDVDGEAVELNMTKTPGREEDELMFIPGAMNALDAFVADDGSESILPTKPAETEDSAEQSGNPNQTAEAAEDGMLMAKVEISKPDEGEDNSVFTLDAENAPQDEEPAADETPDEPEETEEMDGEIVDLSGVENPGAPDINESNPDRKVTIDVSWDGDTLEYGDTVTMSMRLSGYEGLETSVFWQCDKGAGFETADEYSGLEAFDISLNEENAQWTWRAGVHARVAPMEDAPIDDEDGAQPAAEGNEETAALIQGIVKMKKNTFGEAEGDDEAAE